MGSLLNWISANPEFAGTIISLLLLIIGQIFPQTKLLIGTARKMMRANRELVALHEESSIANKEILKAAIDTGKTEAAKILTKQLT